MQRTITVPDYLDKVIAEYAAETGQSYSSVAVSCLEFGLDHELEKANRFAVFMKMRETRKAFRIGLGVGRPDTEEVVESTQG